MSATSAPDQSESMTVDSDFVVVLAALLCALICVVGLIAVARCAWLQRTTGPTPDPTVVPDKGLKKSAIQFLPKLTLKGDGEGDCPICLSGFVPGDEMRVLPQCGHGFHVLCIDTWLRSHSSCPSCRRILQLATCNNCGGLQDSSTSTDLETGFKTTQHHHPNSFLP